MAGGAGAAEPEPNAVFGVLSDIHLVPADARSVERFKKTLRYLDSRKVDGVVICGDLTQRGTIPALMGFGRVWRETFPGDRRSDGGHVERLFVYGDHDTLEFEVRPANAFGAQGEPIRSEPRSFNPTPCATTLW